MRAVHADRNTVCVATNKDQIHHKQLIKVIHLTKGFSGHLVQMMQEWENVGLQAAEIKT